MPKKPHPADQADVEKIANATHFNVHLRTGPHDKIDRQASTLNEAITIFDGLGQTPGGRRPMIYAVTASRMTILVPASMIEAARPRAVQARRTRNRRSEAAENAAKGILPPVPDFSAETHRRFRGKLEALVSLVEARNIEALQGFRINPISTSPKAMARYREHALVALQRQER